MRLPLWLRSVGRPLVGKLLIGVGILGFGTLGMIRVGAQAPGAGPTAIRAADASVYFDPGIKASFAGVLKHHSAFGLTFVSTGLDGFSIRGISSVTGEATWVFRDSLPSATKVVLWEYPNVVPPVSMAMTRFQVGRGRLHYVHGHDRVSIDFPLPEGWPDVHATFMMEILPKRNLPLDSPPVGQLPEVPWASALPLIGVAVGALVWQRGVHAGPTKRSVE